MISILGDCNAKLSTWCRSDKSTIDVSRIDGLILNYGLQQLINEPTHRAGNSSSCIDLLFCSQRNLVMESGVHSSLHLNCHHQIIYAKFKLKVYYPPSYEREVWHYRNADSNAIKKAITDFSWERAFENLSENILSNFIPHDVITIDDRDPPWFNKDVKSLIDEKNKAWRFYVRSNKNDFFLKNLLHFKSNPVHQKPLQKHLRMYLDPKLDFLEHVKNIQAKVNKSIALLRKLQTILPRPTLLTIYKAFIRPHLDHGDTIYDQAYNDSFHQKLESIQYNAALATAGAIRGTSSEKFYQELGLESLQQRRWYRKLCTFLKIIKERYPDYLFSIIPKNNSNHKTRNSYNIPQFSIKHSFFKN